MVKDAQFYKTIFKISLPAAFQSLIGFLVVIADDVMVSALPNGVAAHAAVAQVNSLTALFTATILGLVSGSSVLISQYWGRNDQSKIKKIFPIVLATCLFVAIIFVFLALFFPEFLVSIVLSSGDAETISLAVSYLTIVCISYIPYALAYSLIGMLRSVEVVKITLYITIVSLFVNIGFNYVLIFGVAGFPALGVVGAAIATCITRVIELSVVLFYTLKVQKTIRIRFKDFFHTEKKLVIDYFKYGFPVGLSDAQWALIGMVKTAIIGNISTVFIDANNIAGSMLNLGMMFTFALSGGACIVVGKAVGAGDYKRAREYSNTIQIMFFGFGLIMSGAVFLLREPFTMLYGSASDPAIKELSMTLITIVAVTMIGACYHASCFVGINRGAGDSKFVMITDTICGWFIVIPATLISAFVFYAPMPIIFFCTRIDQCFKWIIAYFRLRGNKWIKNVTDE